MNPEPRRGDTTADPSARTEVLGRDDKVGGGSPMLFQKHHGVAEFASCQRLDRPIQRHQFSALLDRQAQQIGIAYLLMSEDPFGKRTHSFVETNLHWPKAVAGKLRDAVQHLQRLVDVERWLGEPRVGHDSQKACFGQRASDPGLRPGRLEPALHRPVGHMVFEDQGNKNIDVEERWAHGSSASSAFTCWLVMGSLALGRSKTGRPSTYLMRGALRVPRTISSAIALLSDRSRLCAYCAAMVATSSSSVRVVLIGLIMRQKGV